MNVRKKAIIFIVLILFCGMIGTSYINRYNIINAKGHDAGSTAQDNKAVKTDIAQVFIYTAQSVEKENYSAAKIVIEDAKGGLNQTITDNDAAIKIRGNSTSNLKKLPYNIKLSTSQSILGMSAGKKWCLLANYMDTSLMRDKLAYDFAKHIGIQYSCESEYADLWLNGTYQGNYLITQPVEAGNQRVDINTADNEYLLELETSRTEPDTTYFHTGFCRFKLDEPETLTKKQSQYLVKFFAKAESAMLDGNYSKINKIVDIDSFINFYITQELFKNLDVHTSSTRFYIRNNKLFAGPVWDFDLSSGNVALYPYYSHYLLYNNYGKFGNKSGYSCEGFWALNSGPAQNYYDTWIGNLMRCKKFRTCLYERYQKLQNQIVNLYEDNINGTDQIDLLLNRYGKSFARDNKLWPVAVYRNTELYRTDEITFDDSVSYLRSWLKSRNEWLLNALKIKKYKVYFNVNKDTGKVSSKTVTKGCSYGRLPEISRKSYVFQGWYTSKKGGDRITQDSVAELNKDQVLYAHWEKQ